MRRVLSVFLIFAFLQFCFAQAVPPGDLVPLGTGVEIELLENISSETLKAGQSVPFKLVGDLKPHEVVLLPAETRFNGTIAAANPSGHWGKAGAFDLKLEPLKLADGTAVRVDFHRPVRRNTRGEKNRRGHRLGACVDLLFSAYSRGVDLRVAQGQAFPDSRGRALPCVRGGSGRSSY